MTITLDLEPDQIEALTQHRKPQAGEVEAALYQLINQQKAQRPVVLSPKQQAAIALLTAWNAESETASPEERERNDAEYEAFKAGINQARAEEGRAPAFL